MNDLELTQVIRNGAFGCVTRRVILMVGFSGQPIRQRHRRRRTPRGQQSSWTLVHIL